MAYTAEKTPAPPTPDELRARIPGWGVDLDPQDRPAFPKMRFDPGASGAHWRFPERQPELSPRERSIEHRFLTPVFGTAQPTKGLSGVIRRFAYGRFSEGRAAHWLLLVAGDRVDAIESHLASLVTLRPDNPVTQTGVISEVRRHGFSSRLQPNRIDNHHSWLDPILVAGPWVLAGWLSVKALRSLAKR